LGEAQCDKGANEKNLGGRANVTKAPIIDQIDQFILKSSKETNEGIRKILGGGGSGPLDLP